MNNDTEASYVLARSLLDKVRSSFERAVAQTAANCTRDSRLDPVRLDENQWVCYELAMAYADLLTVEKVADAIGRSTKLDARLGLVFMTETFDSIVSRLQGVYSACDLDATILNGLAASTELRRLRHNVAGPDLLAELGRSVAALPGEVGDVAMDEDTAIARDAFQRFGAEVVAPLAESIHRQNLTVPESLLAPMREMGVFGLSIPEQYGGTAPEGDESTSMMIAVTEALSEASLAAAGSLITRPEILARALLAGGTAEQKSVWLPRIAAGDPLVAICITEPDYGSDVASLCMKGTRTDGGWRLNGAKTWCTFAGKAGLLMVLARTDPDRALGHRGLSLLLAEKPSYDGHEFSYLQEGGGRLMGRAIPTIGYRGMHSFDLVFEDFLVPDANVIGGEAGLGKGFYLTMAGMTGGRIQTAGRALGVMRAALKAAAQYAQDRKVFGAPLIDFQLTRVKLAMMAARFAACRHLSYAVGRQLDTGSGSLEASVAKLFVCRQAEYVTREALQIHGGMGYAEETPVSRYYVDARVLSIFEGAEETLALKVVARGLLDSAMTKGVA